MKNSPIMKSGTVSKIDAVDLFCGAGGLSHGLIQAGINVQLGIDLDPACEYPFTQNNNADFLREDIQKIEPESVEPYFRGGNIRLLAGCAPCQTFSTYNQKANSSDSRWFLLEHFKRLITQMKPELVTMENVPGLRTKAVFNDFVSSLEKLGYHTPTVQIVNCADIGIPQTRNRLVLMASRYGQISPIRKQDSAWKTVREAIGGMDELQHGVASIRDPLHQAAQLTQANLDRIRKSTQDGTWRDWPEEMRADCHLKETGKSYPSVYGRMHWDKPSPAITTQFFGFGNGRFGHPDQDRAISLREGAILQSFPSDYQFVAPNQLIYRKIVGRLIGNAVPVKLGKEIGKTLLDHVKEHHGTSKSSY